MKRSVLPICLSIAALALAAVAPAQDHSHDRDHGQDHGSSHSDRPSRSRADRDRRSSDSDRHSDSRSSDAKSSGSRSSDSRGGSDTRSSDPRSSGSRTNDPTRSGDPRGNDPRNSDHTGRTDDRTNRGDDRNGPSSDRGTRSDDRPSRNNPFDRSTGGSSRGGDDRGVLPGRRDSAAVNPRGRAVLGVPTHQGQPGYWDGRGHATAERFGPPPVHNALSIAIRTGGPYRGTEVAVGANIGGLRVGFVSYSAPARRDYYGYGGGPGYRSGYGPGYAPAFGYGYYSYDPYVPGAVVVASPWYRYSYLPPYLDRSHVIVVNDYPAWGWDGWNRYDYDRERDYARDRDQSAIHQSLNDLRDAFEESSSRIADRLIPEEGDVAIFNEGKYDYSLNPDDFQKMFLDGIEQSKTIRYEIEEVRTRGDEVRIRARHTYEDSWGKEQTVIHTITFRRENGGEFVIREFGSE